MEKNVIKVDIVRRECCLSGKSVNESQCSNGNFAHVNQAAWIPAGNSSPLEGCTHYARSPILRTLKSIISLV